MHVGRKRALLLLMAMVLWTALPALACVIPASQPACCHGMMQGCEPSAGMDTMACCQASAPDDAIPPAAAALSSHALTLTQVAASLDYLPALAAFETQPRTAAASPSPPSSSLSSILRI
jgi:hypothetical protein